MKKKLFALMLTAAMACSLAINASAALIPSAAVDKAPEVSEVIAGNGAVIGSNDIAVTPVQDVEELPAAEAVKMETAYKQVNSAGDVSSFVKNSGIDKEVEQILTNTSKTVEDLAVHSMFDVSASGVAAKILEEKGTVDITFQVPGLLVGDVAVVVHFDGAKWDVRPTTVKNGSVTATFTSLSPVMVIVERNAAVTPTVSGTAVVTSPQTSDINFEGTLSCGAMVCTAALLFGLKRRKMV